MTIFVYIITMTQHIYMMTWFNQLLTVEDREVKFFDINYIPASIS